MQALKEGTKQQPSDTHKYVGQASISSTPIYSSHLKRCIDCGSYITFNGDVGRQRYRRLLSTSTTPGGGAHAIVNEFVDFQGLKIYILILKKLL